MKEEQLLSLLALTQIPMIGPINAKSLIAYCGNIVNVFKTPKKKLLAIPGFGPKTIQNILDKNMFARAEKELKFIQKNNITVASYLDDNYPKRLLNHDDAPLIIFSKGNFDPNAFRTVGVVGTRKPSLYGKLSTEQFIEEIQAYDVQIISGLAFGIDSIAHGKSVNLGVENIGVLGHGLDILYPAQNRNLAGKMIEKGGLLTEFLSGSKPARENFPMRNRIIAGMCDAIVVMESAKRGGSIITAEIANGYNKDVFALPGKITDEKSAGTNALIKQNKAHLLESAEDLGYIMRWEKDDPSPKQLPLFIDLKDDEQKVYDLIKDKKVEVSFDYLHSQAQMQISEMANALLMLEFKGLIKTLPGKMYIAIK